MTNFREIKKIAAQLNLDEHEYEYIGIRVQEDTGEIIGETMNHVSYVWTEGKKTNKKTNGVCAINAKTAKYLPEFGGYEGNVIYILGADKAECGYDQEEIIMQDAVVLDIIMFDIK
jgi:hypothetical protein